MKISIVVIVKNESKYIKDCMGALSGQSIRDFEIIVIDNGSSDGTGEIINSMEDRRIQYFYEPLNLGMSGLRNRGIEKASGTYIFFTDGDCVPGKHWLEEGLRILESGKYVGVEGKTYYDTQQKITISDYNTCQLVAGEFMTCNIAYSRDVLEKVNCFDPAFKYGYEDRDLAFRVMKHGKIYFSRDMLVFHQKKKLSIKALYNRIVKRSEDKIYFIKKHGWDRGLYKNILSPHSWFTMLCPPWLVLNESYDSFYDVLLVFLKYIFLVYQRIVIWKTAVKYDIFII
ncbi:MAG: glycosyltransferase [Elusimicrobia bacterium]|nr:glycosyltransferase [Elusimicrobiota bacterium]